MNRIGSKAQQGSISVAAMAVALALTVHAAFGVMLYNGTTAGQRSYKNWFNSAPTLAANSVAAKVCNKG